VLNHVIRSGAPPLAHQIGEARTRYAEAIQQLMEATEYYQQTIGQDDDFCESVPDESERALLIQQAIQDCAYWDAEMTASEIRLARLGRVALTFHMEERGAKQQRLAGRE